jgi:DNA-binding transcriptional ArsR family regulator
MANILNPESEALAFVADYLKVLAERNRLRVLCCLRSGPRNVADIVEATGLTQANTSKHLKVLAQAGMVARQSQGTSVYYRIADPLIFDLCELISQRLSDRLEQQQQAIANFRNQ